MAEREWKPGDVAANATWGYRGIYVDRCVAHRRNGCWHNESGYADAGDDDRRPLIVLDPAATDLYIQSDGRDMTLWHDRGGDDLALLTEHAADPVLWAHLKATLPTRDEPLDEPTDPGVRVRDQSGRTWARINDGWCTPGYEALLDWSDLRDMYHPVTVIQPTTDAEPEARPFRVDDRVRLSEDAVWVSSVGDRHVSPGRGSTGRITAILGDPADHAIVRLDGHPPRGSDVRLTDLTFIRDEVGAP